MVAPSPVSSGPTPCNCGDAGPMAGADLAAALLGDLALMQGESGDSGASFLNLLTSLVATSPEQEQLLTDAQLPPLVTEEVVVGDGEEEDSSNDLLGQLVAALQAYLQGQTLQVPDFTSTPNESADLSLENGQGELAAAPITAAISPDGDGEVSATLAPLEEGATDAIPAAMPLAIEANDDGVTLLERTINTSDATADQLMQEALDDQIVAGEIATEPADTTVDVVEQSSEANESPVTQPAENQPQDMPFRSRFESRRESAENQSEATEDAVDAEVSSTDTKPRFNLREARGRIEPRMELGPNRHESPDGETPDVDVDAGGMELDSTYSNQSVDAGATTSTDGRVGGVTRPGQVDIAMQISESFKMVREQTGQPPARIEIDLDPPELGRMSVELTETDRGVTARISANREATAALVDSQLSTLKQTLEDAGVNVTNFQVQYDFDGSTRNHTRRDAESDSSRDAHLRGIGGAQRRRPPRGSVASPVTVSGGNGGIDLRL